MTGEPGPPPLPLNSLDPDEVAAALAPFDVPAATARLVFAAVHRRGAPDAPAFEKVRGVGKAMAARLRAAGLGAARLRVVSRRRDPLDGFVKYLFEAAGGALVEAVRIPLPAGPDVTPEKHVVCVSSQVGCALACVFCASGRLGGVRDLATWEIVDQVARIRDEAEHPVRGVVFMGMGEPFLNYDNVLRAARILCHPAGLAISGKAITLSTAGVVPAISRFTAERHPFRLAISLHSAIESKRQTLVPLEKRYPLPTLLEAARAHAAATRTRITFEYTAISGVNVGEEDARALVDRLAGIPVRLDIIDVNDATGRFRPPDPAEWRRFRDALEPLGQPIVRRYSGGQSVEAGCGMLAAEHLVPLRPSARRGLEA